MVVRALVVIASVAGCGRLAFDPGGPLVDDAGSDDATLAVIASCAALPSTCGPQGGQSCCASVVVEGGTFFRGYDSAADATYKDTSRPATLSPFRLDIYEVTVGRFRAFLDAGGGTRAQPPAAGAGARPTVPGSGWDPQWNASLPVDRAALETAMKCHGVYQTWTDAPGANEERPINCITFFEAAAFCAWDGGFLPTEAQSMFVAGGGSEQRAFPWSNPAADVTIDCSIANYGQASFPTTACEANGPAAVGSRSPQGDSRWGHADLGGNLAEWLLDWRVSPLPMPCMDCVNLTQGEMVRSVRDGSFIDTEVDIRAHYRDVLAPADRHPMFGVRCARPI